MKHQQHVDGGTKHHSQPSLNAVQFPSATAAAEDLVQQQHQQKTNYISCSGDTPAGGAAVSHIPATKRQHIARQHQKYSAQEPMVQPQSDVDASVAEVTSNADKTAHQLCDCQLVVQLQHKPKSQSTAVAAAGEQCKGPMPEPTVVTAAPSLQQPHHHMLQLLPDDVHAAAVLLWCAEDAYTCAKAAADVSRHSGRLAGEMCMQLCSNWPQQ